MALGQFAGRANPPHDFQIPYEVTRNPVFYFTRATFEPYVGGVFVARGAGGRQVQLKLDGITDYAPSPSTRLSKRPHRQTHCFSLQFSADRPLSQLTAVHNMGHGGLGSFDLFMTQSEAGGVQFYQAVINHVVSS